MGTSKKNWLRAEKFERGEGSLELRGGDYVGIMTKGVPAAAMHPDSGELSPSNKKANTK